MPHFARIIAVTTIVLSLALPAHAQSYRDTPPPATNDGWKTSTLAAEKIDPALITPMLERIRKGDFPHLQSLLIVRHGNLVLEEYFPREEGDRREQAFRRVAPRELTSATKSITSLLLGIAIDQHLIKGPDEKISIYFPEYAGIFADPAKSKLTLHDLFTMSAGLSWDEWTRPYTDPLNDHVAMLKSDDPLRYLFDRKIVAAPGEQFAYNSGISIALGHILFKASGLKADKFADKFLFAPLGITDYYWAKYPDELVQTGGGLFLRPRDLAKIGQLLLDGGIWQGKQIISREWITVSTRPHVPAARIPAAAHADGYGYQWWLDSFRSGDQIVHGFSARGRGGQFLLVFPEQQLVVVITSAVDNPDTFGPLDLLQKNILPALGSLPPPAK